jgi:hypothetical protein
MLANTTLKFKITAAMNKKVKISLFLFLIFFTIPGMNQTVFHKTFGGYGMEYTSGMEYQPSGNYIVSGKTNSFSGGIYQLFLSEINTAGQVLWFKTFGLSSSLWDMDMKRTSDGNYMFASSYGVNNQLVLIKTNQAGDTLWTKSYSFPIQIYLTSLYQASDGSCLISANLYGTSHSIVLIKADSTGNILWANQYHSNYSILSSDLIQTDDGGIAVFGALTSFQLQYEMLLLRVDSSGNVISAKQYGQNNNYYEFASSIKRTSDGGYILAGYNSKQQQNTSGIYLIKLNNVFDTLWTRTLYDSFYDYNYHFNSLIAQTDDGGFIISGSSGTHIIANQISDSSGIILVKTDSLGFPLWSKRYGEFPMGGGETASGFFQTDDMGYVIGGFSSGAGTFVSGFNDIYLIKTDSLGNTDNCLELPSIYVHLSVNTIVIPLSVSRTNLSYTSLSNQFIINSHTIMDSLLCVLVSKPEIDQIPSEISCYPNPFSDYTKIQYHSNGYEDDKLLLFDLTGRLLREIKCSNGECVLHRESLKAGMYLIQINSDQKITGSGKIIVE